MVGVAVDDELRPVHPDGAGKTARTEKCPDRLGLPDDRVDYGRVVEQDDALLAAGDGFEALLERLDLGRGLTVDLPQRRLAEVGDLRARESSDESLRPDDADLEARDLENRVRAVEHHDAAPAQCLDDVCLASGVVVVVAQNGDHGHAEPSAGVRQHGRLLGKAVRREIARDEDEVALRGDVCEGSRQMLAQSLAGVDVARGRDSQVRGHATMDTPWWGSPNCDYGYFPLAMPSAPPDNFQGLLGTMKRASAILRESEIEFMLGGGLAVWARGGPYTDHDVDLYLRETDARRALEALVAEGMREDRPPEDWLYKVWDEDNLVDLIFRPAGGPIGDEHFERATAMEVNAQRMLVASSDDVIVTKLLALTEQEPDYRAILEVARSVREQVDWQDVETRTQSSPFARAFFTLCEGLGIIARPTVYSARQ